MAGVWSVLKLLAQILPLILELLKLIGKGFVIVADKVSRKKINDGVDDALKNPDRAAAAAELNKL